MKVKIGTVATQFLFWEYLFLIFGIGSLQCPIPRIPSSGFQPRFWIKSLQYDRYADRQIVDLSESNGWNMYITSKLLTSTVTYIFF